MLDKIKKEFKRWLAPPVCGNDEEKTWRANLLNTAIIVSLLILILTVIGNMLGGKVLGIVYLFDGIMFVTLILLRRLLFAKNFFLVSILFVSMGIILITMAIASMGTIRTPTAMALIILIIIAGLFGKKGLVLSTAASSLAILGLMLAENAGMLPTPDYAVNITQWITYTVIFGLTGSLTYFSYHTTHEALIRLITENTERKKVEEALRKSEEKYRLLFDHSPEAIIIRDAEKILYLNKAGLKLLGADTFAEVIGTRIEQYMSAETLTTISLHIKKMILTGETSTTFEATYLRLNGISFEAEVVSAPIFYEGKPAFQIIMRDITERNKMDKFIRQLSRVVEQSASSIVITDLEGNIEFTNPAFTERTGYTAEEALGQNPRILKSEHTLPEVYIEMWETLLQGNVWRGELLNKKKNGEHYWEQVIISPVKDREGKTTHFAAVKDDITARKKIELDLNESEEKFRNLVEQSEDGIVLVAQSGVILEWNQGMTDITGFSRDSMIGTLLWESQYQLVIDEKKTPALAKRIEIGIRTLLANKELLMNKKMEERSIQRPDGRIRNIQSIIYPITIKNDFMMGIISRDITEKKEVERALQESETLLRKAQEMAHLGSWQLDLQTNELFWSEEIYRIFGVDAQSFGATSEAFLNAIHPDDREMVEQTSHLSVQEQQPYDVIYRILRPDDSIRTVHQKAYNILNDAGETASMTGFVQDITEAKKAEYELNKLAQAVNYSGSSILITDIDGKIEFANTAFSEISGYSVDEVVGQTPSMFKSGKTDTQVYEELWETIKEGKVWRGELLNRKKNGELYWDYTVIAPIKDKDEEVTHYVAVRDDVTKRKEEEGRLVHMATHDLLTKLPNRAFFNNRMNHALTLAKRNDWHVALLFIDLNDFKLINDRFGHGVGDDALMEFGKRLKESTRDSDTVARLGGDEFACLLENTPSKKYLSIVAEKIIANLAKPFKINQEQSVQLEASIGISIFPQDGKGCAALLKNADQAMYQAKKIKGKSLYKFYDASSK